MLQIHALNNGMFLRLVTERDIYVRYLMRIMRIALAWLHMGIEPKPRNFSRTFQSESTATPTTPHHMVIVVIVVVVGFLTGTRTWVKQEQGCI